MNNENNDPRYKVSLEDKGQDLLHLITDEDGQVLEATTPFLTSIYKGAFIPIEQQVIGTACMIHNPPHQNFGFLKYKAIAIVDLTLEEPKGIFYVTQAGTGNSLTPTVVGTFTTRSEATKAADKAFQTMLAQVDEAYPDGGGSLPDVFAVWSNEEYAAVHGQATKADEDIFLDGEDLNGVVLPTNLAANLNITSCKLEGCTLPKRVEGYLALSYVEIEGITLPEFIGGNVYLREINLALFNKHPNYMASTRIGSRTTNCLYIKDRKLFRTGCFIGDADKFLREVIERHGKESFYYEQYEAFVNLCTTTHEQ